MIKKLILAVFAIAAYPSVAGWPLTPLSYVGASIVVVPWVVLICGFRRLLGGAK